jgi:hypothetical protein
MKLERPNNWGARHLLWVGVAVAIVAASTGDWAAVVLVVPVVGIIYALDRRAQSERQRKGKPREWSAGELPLSDRVGRSTLAAIYGVGFAGMVFVINLVIPPNDGVRTAALPAAIAGIVMIILIIRRP